MPVSGMQRQFRRKLGSGNSAGKEMCVLPIGELLVIYKVV